MSKSIFWLAQWQPLSFNRRPRYSWWPLMYPAEWGGVAHSHHKRVESSLFARSTMNFFRVLTQVQAAVWNSMVNWSHCAGFPLLFRRTPFSRHRRNNPAHLTSDVYWNIEFHSKGTYPLSQLLHPNINGLYHLKMEVSIYFNILMVEAAKIYFIPSQCLYAAPDYVIDVRECGHLDSCCIASCLCNNVDVNIRAYVIMST